MTTSVTTTTIPANVYDFLMRWEGGFVNNRADKGGATNKGVTQSTYDHYRISHGLRQRAVYAIEDEEVQAIYQEGYWGPSHAGDCAPPLNLVTFDTAVLWGPDRARRWLQLALGVTADGIVGPKYLAALAACEPTQTARRMLATRVATHNQRVAQDPSQQIFLRGWLARCDALSKALGET